MFCEGKVTEPDYVNGLRRLPEISSENSLKIEISPEHAVPLKLVEMAVERSRDEEVDECWCIFDVEWPKKHPNLEDAVAMAKENKIKLAISNPCFELWLLLHFADHNACVSNRDMERMSQKYDGRRGKAIDAAVYMPRRHEAARRARRLQARHERDGKGFPDNNPSSGMFEFLEALETPRGDKSRHQGPR